MKPCQTSKVTDQNRMRFVSITLMIVLLISSFGFLISPLMVNVSAAPDTHTWDGGGADAFAGTKENWVSDIHPEAGDSVIFNAGALPCTWNLSITLDNFSIVTGYAGILTIGANFGVTSFYQIAGTLTGSASYILTSSGNVCHGGTAAMSGQLLRLIMTGEGSKLTGTGDYRLLGLQASANITVTHNGGTIVYLAYAGSPYLTVDAGKTLTIVSGKQLDLYLLTTFTYSNLGTIAGPGLLDVRAYGADKTVSFGTITAPCQMWISASEAASRVISLGANANFASIDLWSSHVTNTITLSHGTNYQLTVAGLVALGTRSIMTQGTGTWSFGSFSQTGIGTIFNQGGPLTINGALTQSAGTFTGSASYVATVYGSISQSGTAVVTTHILRLRMMGEGSTLNGTDEYRLVGLQVSANVTITNSNTTTFLAYSAVASYLTVDAGKTLTIPSGKQLWAYFTPTFTYTNSGTIAGAGILNLRPFGMNSTIIFGTITAPVYMWIDGSDSRTLSLGSNTIFGSSLSLWSSNTSGWITLSHGNNYSLNVIGGVGLAQNSILSQGTGKWAFGYYLQNGDGSDFIQGGELDIAGDFTQTRGTLHTIGHNITIGGNWSSKDSYVDSLVVNGTASYLSIASEAIVVNMAANYTEIPGTSNFSGPSNVMIEAPNGDYLGFVREGESHVGVGDYAVMNLYRSIDEGVTWSYERTLVNETNRDVRNYASGVTQTGRIFIFYIVYDVDTGTWPNAQYYNYSDDNGLSWSAQQTLTMPTLDALIPTSGGQVWGKIHPIGGGGVGFAFYTGNATHTQGRFVISFDDGMTWDQHIIWPSSVLPNALTETDSLYIGNNRLIACSRTDGTNGTRMFTSIDNGLTWADRGIGIYNAVRPPTLTKIVDNLGRTWALLTLAYSDSVFYSIAYADTLMAEGVSAWPYADYFSNDNGGMYATIILNETTGKGVMMVNYQATMTNSTNRVFNITASVNCTRAILSNLTVNAGCVAELESREWNLDFIISNQLINYGEIIQNGKRLNISGSSTTPLMGYGLFDGDIYLNGSIASKYEVQTGLPMGNLHTDRDTKISFDATHFLRIAPSASTFINVSILSDTSWTIETSDPGVTVIFILSGLEAGRLWYNVYVDGQRIEQIKPADNGTITFTYSGPWTEHTFVIEETDPFGSLYDMGPLILTIGVGAGLAAIAIVAIGSRLRRR